MGSYGRDRAVEQFEQNGYTAYVVPDEDPPSPKDWDNLGTLVTWHRRYRFDEDGEKRFGSVENFLEIAKESGWIVVPVSMIDHSGVSLYIGSSEHPADPGGWDSGPVGFIYATPESIEKIGTPRDKVEEVLKGEVETWNQYVSGDVYGVVVKRDADGERMESCWGFYGLDDAKGEAKSMLESVVASEMREAQTLRAYGYRL